MILIVEDDFLNRELLAAQVEDEDFCDVVAVSTADKALATLATQQPDVMLIDLAMPGMTGFELVEHLHDAGQDIPIVVVSALDLTTAEQESLASMGVIRVFKKASYDSDTLVDVIRGAMEGATA